jgi:hypothetical protein
MQLLKETEGKVKIVRAGHRWKYTIKTDIKRIHIEQIQQPQYIIESPALVNTK